MTNSHDIPMANSYVKLCEFQAKADFFKRRFPIAVRPWTGYKLPSGYGWHSDIAMV